MAMKKVDRRLHSEFSTKLSSGVLGRAKSGKTTLLLLGAIELGWLKPEINIFFVSSRESPKQLLERAKAYGRTVPPNLGFHQGGLRARAQIIAFPSETVLVVKD
jgi:hypothetical protein